MQLDKDAVSKKFNTYVDGLDKKIYNKLDSFNNQSGLLSNRFDIFNTKWGIFKGHPLDVVPYFISREVVYYAYSYDERKGGG
jgi:hypothetical protein